jgi:hypothetical protein
LEVQGENMISEMRATIIFVIGVLSFLMMNCSIKPDERAKSKGFIYQSYFLLDSIPKTLDPIEEAEQIVELNAVPDSMLVKWVEPFGKKGSQNKMVSYQYGESNYHVITIMIIDEIYVDKESKKIDILLSSQYLLTVKDDGSFIDGLKVEEGLSKDYLDETFVDGKEVMSTYKWAKFKRDSVKTYDLTSYIKRTVLSEREDYIQTPDGKVMGTLETVLQEEFEGTDETAYLIDMNGKIKKLSEKKGELKKLSEHTGELIKN